VIVRLYFRRWNAMGLVPELNLRQSCLPTLVHYDLAGKCAHVHVNRRGDYFAINEARLY
jgi:hypothetical protein